ncbi:MAG TPA: ABC transporter permease [Acidimicrobiales bacterium]|nr:ABC transporter permease [Acidimicrobiales bacterium]
MIATTTTIDGLAGTSAAAWPSFRGRLGAFTTLVVRRLSLNLRNPRAIVLPLATPVLIAVVMAPALAKTAGAVGGVGYMTYLAIGTAGLLVPLSCMQAGLSSVVDRVSGNQPDLVAAPVPRAWLVIGNLSAAIVTSALQVGALVVFSAFRGATFHATASGILWFSAASLGLATAVYGLAELLANRTGTAEEYVNAIPTVGIAPWFFAGSLFPISSMPGWIGAVAKALPVTHAVALMRYGLVDPRGSDLHAVWGMNNAAAMAGFSLTVLAAYAAVLTAAAIKVFQSAAVR